MSLHPLTVLRCQMELSVQALHKLSGVSVETILRIEKGSERRINFTTAEAIANAVNQPVHTLFHPSDLTHVGRPAGTGRPISSQQREKATSGTFCLHCFLKVANKASEDGCCENCGRSDFGRWGEHTS